MKGFSLSILICLCTLSAIAQEENIIYSFKTKNNKVVQLIYESDSIFIFRLLSGGKVKVEVTDDLTDTDTIFTVNGYHRGGGVENAAMDYNNVEFSYNGNYYDIYYVWAVNEEDPDIENEGIFGIKISEDGAETSDLKGKKVITGSVYGWSFYDILPEKEGGLANDTIILTN